VWTIIYLLNLRTALNIPINWLLSELLFLAGTTASYLIAAIVELAVSYGSSYIAAGVFGLFNTAAYGAAAFLMYSDWKGSTGGVVTSPGV
jgi:hypothetical protein